MRTFSGFLLSACLAVSTCSLMNAQESAAVFRLPDTARPTHYSLDMTIVPSEPAFHGVARIAVELKAGTRTIWLNQKDLTVQRVMVSAAGKKPVTAQVETPDEFLAVKLPAAMGPGKIELEIAYEGKLNDKTSEGAFRKRAGDDWYVYTSFTPIEARRAFPCFDEPGYKAPWAVTMHVKKSDVAVANAPEALTSDEPNGMKRVVFKETQPLPSEVVAFAVGPFDVVDAGVAGAKKIPVRIITPKGRGVEAGPAAKATAEILPREEAYTGIPYPWDKLDHIAVIDLPFGAVENPGLITYRDAGLLSPVAKDSPRRVRSMRGTMTHEMAHQWFGDMVTQAWWDDTWLSEGFATWMAAKIGDMELPEAERGISMVQGRDRIMATDAQGKRPVRLDMHSRAEIKDVYSQMVYQKGGATLKMVEDWIGADAMQRGLQAYLKAHMMSNATTADLESALAAASGKEVAPVMDAMVNRVGFPVIQFKTDGGKLMLDQSPVVGGGGAWMIPICLHKEDGSRQCEVVSTEHAEIAVGGAPVAATGRRGAPQAWVGTNAFGSGYYRSELSKGMLDALVGRGYAELSESERLALMVDMKSQVK